jgi:hypothetical protein
MSFTDKCDHGQFDWRYVRSKNCTDACVTLRMNDRVGGKREWKWNGKHAKKYPNPDRIRTQNFPKFSMTLINLQAAAVSVSCGDVFPTSSITIALPFALGNCRGPQSRGPSFAQPFGSGIYSSHRKGRPLPDILNFYEFLKLISGTASIPMTMWICVPAFGQIAIRPSPLAQMVPSWQLVL